MIQATQQPTIPTDTAPQQNIQSKVYGFGTPTGPQAQPPEEHHFANSELAATLYHWWHRLAVILLTLHGLIGLWESVAFILFEYPELNELLDLHQITTQEANQLLAGAIITIFGTLVSVFFAIRLAKVRETTAHNVDLIVATVVIITTRFIQAYLIELDLLNLILNTLG